ncbi:MAG: DUF4279 domain-containing protein, partial [Dokdonella sp.]|uniref:DUF4279 domain-containing protein n=1 Tax=Dokdonella sp. TaxID=2291710 RepID=UPI003BB04CFE
ETLVGKKTGIARVSKFGMWRLEATEHEPADLDAQVAELLSKLTADLSAWQSVTSVHTADLFCGLFMNRPNEGIDLSPKSLSALGSRGVVLGLDIYSGDDEGDA